MYRIILLSLLAFPLSAHCQYSDTTKTQQALESRMHRAGLEFLSYKKEVGIGTTLEIAGTAAAVAGGIVNAQVNKELVSIGIGIGVIGFIIERAAIGHIGNAGVIMRGNSIIIPLGK